ncbi:MAG: 3-deoxy-D-manno-octulosonic acid transferase [Roseomonas sp.]|nr:3-deoxy-D-manno-octulosonic acid transferase [Roseomonas sp.]MCA3290264.1 3-deoxy-D-manno-octulosonic acid transferase [Roseomonas sp.]MCA3295209.1 3-deoxy-D-manno-octulosonic acid transferase [Roseomonas sp.]
MIAQSLSAKLLAALWALVASLLAPLLPFYLRRRVAKGKEIAERLAERQGHGAARPPGRLIWCHAASNGETLSLLPLMEALAKQDPALSFLVTTGTVTSARLLEQRLSPELAHRTQHRFLPLDVPRWVARFLAGWRPDLAVIVESEIWPNMLAAAYRRGVPLALVNARMSARSARGWGWAPGFARALLGRFALILAQTEADAARFAALAERPVPCWGNLKYAAPPLPADPVELARLTLAWEGRPVWLAASTHPGEDEIILAAHRLLAPDHPGLLTVMVPRHPQRGPDIAALAGDLSVARRGAGQDAGPGVAVYVADTLGELGLFYRLARVALIGGSLVPHGGQNPLEAARLGCPIITGPHHFNFGEIITRLSAAHALVETPDGPGAAQALAATLARLLADPAAGQAMAAAAEALAQDQAGLPGRIATSLLPLIRPAR